MRQTKEERERNQQRMNREAEQLFQNARENLVTQSKAHNPRQTADEYIEGADITSDYLEPTYNATARRTADLFFNPYEEIKSTCGVIGKTYDYNFCEGSGTLPFEIFHRWIRDPGIEYPYAGWILSLFNPERLSEIKHKHGVPDTVREPSTLAFFIFEGAQLKERPIACIAFENVDALKERLLSCLPAEWDLYKWNLPNMKDLYWRRWQDFDRSGLCKPEAWSKDNGGMIQNCWHIPIQRIADLATVTMIGADIATWHKDKAQKEKQTERLQYIKSFAYDLRVNSGGQQWKERRISEHGELIDQDPGEWKPYKEQFGISAREYRRSQEACFSQARRILSDRNL